MPISPQHLVQDLPIRELIAGWLQHRRLSAGEADAVLHGEGVLPGAAQWRKFLQRLFLFAGVLACAAGVVFFMAFNWQDLSRLAKFALLQGALAAAALYGWRRGADSAPGQAALLGAMLLCGALLAYLGQTYQTGADTYQLFLGWAVLILPWVVAARLEAAWALWLVLVNLAALLYFGRVRADVVPTFFESGHAVLFWTDAAALLAAERFMRGSESRLFARFAALLVLACAGVGLVGWIIGAESGQHAVFVSMTRVAMLAAVPGLLVIYRQRRDMLLLAASTFAVIVIASFVIGRVFVHIGDSLMTLLLVGLFLIGSSAAAATWLRSTRKQWSGETP